MTLVALLPATFQPGERRKRRVTRMKIRIFLLLAVGISTAAALGQATKSATAATGPQAQPEQPGPTIASTLDGEIGNIEKQVVDAADAMPEDKFNFSPESLRIPGTNYNGVRT